MDLELEIKLVPSVEHDERLFSVLQSENRFGNFSLRDFRINKMHDAYYDTKNTLLFNKGMYLRTRYNLTMHHSFLTFRGFTATGAKILHVSEINSLIDQNIILAALSSLRSLVEFVTIPRIDETVCSIAKCEEIFLEIGLQKILALDNSRSEYSLFHNNLRIGCLSFDDVLFDFKGSGKSFHEAELKLLQDHVYQLDNILMELTRCVGPYFQSTSITKLQRGLSLKRSLYN